MDDNKQGHQTVATYCIYQQALTYQKVYSLRLHYSLHRPTCTQLPQSLAYLVETDSEKMDCV